MAGHVHTYERSHSIVETYPGYKVQLPKEKTVDKFIKYEEYDSSGTIYVVEGDAGNNDEVLTQAQGKYIVMQKHKIILLPQVWAQGLEF